MKNSYFYLLIFVSIILFNGCGKDNPVAPPVVHNPEITSITPNLITPFDTLTISGKYFGESKAKSEVYFDTLKVLIYISWSDTEIKLVVPEIYHSGTIKIIVDTLQSNSYNFNYNDAPYILSAGSGKAKVGDEINISGFNFGNEIGIVKFNGVQAKEIISWNNSNIVVRVPEGAISGELVVFANNKYSKGYYFTIEEPEPPKNPIIYSLNPNTERIGNEIEVIGKYFGNTQGTNYVDFNGVKAIYYSVWNDSLIKVQVPQNSTSGPVTASIGGILSNSITFTLKPDLPSPSIFSLSKNYFKVGEEITISGQYFGDSKTSKSKVVFNGIEAITYSLWQDNTIKVTVPLGTQNGKVIVIVNSKISNAVDFTIEEIQKNPVISSVNPITAFPGESVSISGNYFGNSSGATSYVMFGNYKAVTTNWSPTSITAIVPDMGPGLTRISVFVDDIQSNYVTFTVKEKTEIIVQMVEIPSGNFLMGNSDPLTGDAYPQHKVTFTNSLLIGKTEISQAQYKKVMNYKNPSKILDDNNPVEQITFLDAINFCNNLSKLEGYSECYTINGSTVTWNKSANGYRLLTEAEWEYACRAGSTGNVGLKNGVEPNIDEVAWTTNNTTKMKHVGLLPPNDFGLYDMQGNAAEWVWDFYDFYQEADLIDPSGPNDGVERCYRGGSYMDKPSSCYTYIRNAMNGTQSQYFIGFRICRTK